MHRTTGWLNKKYKNVYHVSSFSLKISMFDCFLKALSLKDSHTIAPNHMHMFGNYILTHSHSSWAQITGKITITVKYKLRFTKHSW